MKNVLLLLFSLIGYWGTAQTPVTSAMVSDTSILAIAEQMPRFPGDSLAGFIGHIVKYPQPCKDAGIEGKVFVMFVVETDGTITNPSVVRGVNGDLGKLLNDEALRVVKLMPKMIPAKDKGKAVRVRYALPLDFKLK